MASDTGGVPAFSIQGRLYRERERLSHGGMTEDEREFRKNWIKDQILCDNEPVHVPQLYKAQNNIFKRIMNAPLNILFMPFEKKFGPTNCYVVKGILGKCLLGVSLIYAGTYYFKYNQNDWTRKGGWRVLPNRPACLPGETYYTKVKYDPSHEISFIHKNEIETDDLINLELLDKKIDNTLENKIKEVNEITEITEINVIDVNENTKNNEITEITEISEIDVNENIKNKEITEIDVNKNNEITEINETEPMSEFNFDLKKVVNVENTDTEDITVENVNKIKKSKKPLDIGDKGPNYRSLGSYYASRGFENSPI